MDRTEQRYQRRNVYPYAADDYPQSKRSRRDWYDRLSPVGRFESSGGSSQRSSALQNKNYILRVEYFDLHFSLNELQDIILKEFSRFGECDVLLGEQFNHRKGTLFVEFCYSDQALRARDALHDRVMFGRDPIQVTAMFGDRIRTEAPPRFQHDRYLGGDEYRSGNLTRNEPFFSTLRDVSLSGSRTYNNDRGRSQCNDSGYDDREINSGPARGSTNRGYDVPKFSGFRRNPIGLKDPMCPEDDVSATRSLFVGNLHAEITENEIRSAFGKFGRVEDVDVKYGMSRGRGTFAFVRFADLDMAYNAISGLRGETLRGVMLKIGYAKSRATSVVWISGISHSMSLSELKYSIEDLCKCPILEIKKSNNNPDHVYVEFSNVEDASSAMKILRGKTLGNGGHRLRVDYAEADQIQHNGINGRRTGRDDQRAEDRSREHDRTRLDRSGSFNQSDSHCVREDLRVKISQSKRTMNNNIECDSNSKHSANSEGNSKCNHKTKANGGDSNVAECLNCEPRDKRTTNDRSTCNSDSRLQQVQTTSTTRRDSNCSVDLTKVKAFSELSRLATVVWNGAFDMKNSRFMTRFYHIGGNIQLIDQLLENKTVSGDRQSTSSSSSPLPVLKLDQKLKFDKTEKLEELHVHLKSFDHVVLVALSDNGANEVPTASDNSEMTVRPFHNLVLYWKKQMAAGIVSLAQSDAASAKSKGLMYAFPASEFSRKIVQRYIQHISAEEFESHDHLVVVIIKS